MNNTIVKQGWDFRVEPAPMARPAPPPAPPKSSVSLAEAVRESGGAFHETLQADPGPLPTVTIVGAGSNGEDLVVKPERGSILGDFLYQENTNPFMKLVEADPNGIDQHAPGAKLDNGKQLAGVLLDFSRALEAVADVGTFGANKYTRLGWASVPNGEQRYTDALMRHLLKMQREDIDPDSGLDHLAHLAWNCLAVLELRLRGAA